MKRLLPVLMAFCSCWCPQQRGGVCLLVKAVISRPIGLIVFASFGFCFQFRKNLKRLQQTLSTRFLISQAVLLRWDALRYEQHRSLLTIHGVSNSIRVRFRFILLLKGLSHEPHDDERQENHRRDKAQRQRTAKERR